MTILEEIIEYCKEDNETLADEFKSHIADFFDFKNRQVKVEKRELSWIKKNLSKNSQKEIFGLVVE